LFILVEPDLAVSGDPSRVEMTIDLAPGSIEKSGAEVGGRLLSSSLGNHLSLEGVGQEIGKLESRNVMILFFELDLPAGKNPPKALAGVKRGASLERGLERQSQLFVLAFAPGLGHNVSFQTDVLEPPRIPFQQGGNAVVIRVNESPIDLFLVLLLVDDDAGNLEGRISHDLHKTFLEGSIQLGRTESAKGSSPIDKVPAMQAERTIIRVARKNFILQLLQLAAKAFVGISSVKPNP
jgi:hypothetical protein